MATITVTEFLSLDGVMEDPAWSAPFWSDDIAAFKQEEQFAAQAMLLGRVTYEGFVQAWPGRTDEEGYADHFNSIPKYVVSTTLTDADMERAGWNGRLLTGSAPEAVAELKKREEGNLIVHGSGTLVRTLVSHDLVDELRLLVYPVVVGTGRHLFDESTTATLDLLEARPIGKTGVTALRYAPKRD